MKKLFYPEPLGDNIVLPEDMTHHINHVMRHNWAKPITITGADGKTGTYRIIGEVDGQAQCEIIAYGDGDVKRMRKVLVQSLLKGDKLEWVLQKATELDVDAIYLVETRHNVVKYDGSKLLNKKKRWDKILMEAAQQCGRPRLPELIVDCALTDVLDRENNIQWVVAYENEEGLTLKDVLAQVTTGVGIIIGPEGGLHVEEVQALHEKGVTSVSLGHTILRAETAAVAVMAMIHYELEL